MFGFRPLRAVYLHAHDTRHFADLPAYFALGLRPPRLPQRSRARLSKEAESAAETQLKEAVTIQ
jgi:hypothetical protein